KFAFINNAAGTPTASISANNGDNATYLTGNGVLGTTNAQTLTLGSSSTGDVVLSGRNGQNNGIVLSGYGAGALQTDSTGRVTSGTLPVGYGGTGVATFGGTNTLLYTTSADTLASLATSNNASLITNGAGVPSWTGAGANQVLRSDGAGSIAYG